MTLRILILSNCPLDPYQGSGYVICGYANGLRAKGHHVDMFGPESVEFWRSAGARFKRWRLALGLLAQSLISVSTGKYDVVELWGGECFLSAGFLRHLPKRRFVLISRANGFESYMSETITRLQEMTGRVRQSGRLRNWQEDLCDFSYSCGDALTTVSHRDREYAIRRQLQMACKVVTIENPLPAQFLRLTVDLQRDAHIIFVGSWSTNKGSAIIPAAVSQILREFPSATFTLVGVGDCPISELFDADIRARVTVVPFLRDKQAQIELYKSARIAIMPSGYESFGLAASEAMACGCAVVSTKTAGFAASLVNGKQVLLMNDWNQRSLYESIKLLLRDDSLRIAIAEGGYRRVQLLTWEHAIRAIEHLYIQLTKSRMSDQRIVVVDNRR